MNGYFGENWRTTSLGITSIASAVVNLVFSIKRGVADQTVWMLCITNVLTGLGLIFSRDSQASARNVEKTDGRIADLQNQVSQVKNDTSQIKKP